jgi:hypothetical protein
LSVTRNGTSLRVGEELVEAVDEVGAVEGVAANAHARGLTEAGRRGLRHGLIGERAGARDDACAVSEKGDVQWNECRRDGG